MDTVQEPSEPLPSPSRSHRRVVLLIVVVGISTVIAVVWALSDAGRIGGYWGKLAIIFFAWLTVVLAAWALSRVKE